MVRQRKRSAKGLTALALCLAAALLWAPAPWGNGAVAGPLRAGDFASLSGDGLDFDGLKVQPEKADDAAKPGLDLSLGAALDGLALEREGAQRQPPPAAPARVGERGPSEGEWWVVPLLPKRDPDKEMTLLQSLTPMGFGFVRSF